MKKVKEQPKSKYAIDSIPISENDLGYLKMQIETHLKKAEGHYLDFISSYNKVVGKMFCIENSGGLTDNFLWGYYCRKKILELNEYVEKMVKEYRQIKEEFERLKEK